MAAPRAGLKTPPEPPTEPDAEMMPPMSTKPMDMPCRGKGGEGGR